MTSDEGFSPWGDGAPASLRKDKKTMAEIKPITMPKWGLAMEEGVLARWAVEEGAEIAAGQEIMDIETTKIANVFESPVAGVLRKKVVRDGETAPVGALLGVVADSATPDTDVEKFVGAFLENFKPPEPGTSGAPEPQTLQAGGRTIRYLKAGPDAVSAGGTPLLLLHGFGADLNGWMFNIAELSEDRPVFAIDLPGHGGSSKHDVAGGTVEGLAEAVLAFMDAAEIDAAHIVGHSLGGAIAVEIATSAPDRAVALTLVAPAGLGEEIAQDFIDGFIAESRARKLRPVLEMLVADPGLVTGDMVEDVLKFKRLDGALDALKTIAAANFSGGAQTASVRQALASLKVPVQIIWGEDDRILPARHADDLPGSIKVTRVPGAGHIPHMEKAAEVNTVIKEIK